MFSHRILPQVKNRVLATVKTDESGLCPLISLVRWKRPPWAPLRASKLFRIKSHHAIDPEEYKFVKQTTDRYNTEMRSLRSFIQEELEAKAAAQSYREHVDFEEVFKTSLKENTIFNQKSAALRSVREKEEKKLKEEQELNLMIEFENEKQKRLETSRQEVLDTIDQSKQFITLENLDSAIEEALNTRKLYNFAIDTEGRRFVEQEDGSTVVVETNQKSAEPEREISEDK